MILNGSEHSSASSLMCLLSGLQDLIKVNGLLIEGGFLILALVLLRLFLVNLLLDPLLLLLLLQLHSLLLHFTHMVIT